MATVPVKPELLRWAIERSGLTVESLSEQLPKLGDWINGNEAPTISQLKKFARKTMAPFGALFLDVPPHEVLPVPDFRTIRDQRLHSYSPNLIDTVQAIQLRQEWLREWLVAQGAKPLDFVGSASISTPVETVVSHMRDRLDLSTDWAASLSSWEVTLRRFRSSIEQIGITVFSNSVVSTNTTRPLDANEFRGFVLCDPIAPVIFVNDADAMSARLFTLAHEIAHVWIGQSSLFNLEHLLPASDQTEQFCNRVAAEFLAPSEEFLKRWNNVNAAEFPIYEVARSFKVSPLVAGRRALDLGLISKKQFFGFYNQDRQAWEQKRLDQRDKQGGGDFYATQSAHLGRRFAMAIVQAAREGSLLFRDAYRLTDLHGSTFHKFADLVIQRSRNKGE